MTENEIKKTVKKLGLKIGATPEGILLKASLNPFTKENFGFYLIGLSCMFVLYFCFQGPFSWLLLFCSIMFTSVFVVFVVMLLKSYLDYILISENYVQFKNNFKLKTLEKKDIKKVKIKFENNVSKRKGSYSEYRSRQADIFIKTAEDKFLVFEFSADQKYSGEVDEIAVWIKTEVLTQPSATKVTM